MEFIYGLIGAFVASFIVIGLFRVQHNRNAETNSRTYAVLYESNNRNSYEKANDVFAILDAAKINPNFLGGRYEK